MKQIDMFEGLQPPNTFIQEILFYLIINGTVSILDFPHLSGFRSRISDLKRFYNLGLSTEIITNTSKYGNKSKYAKHILIDKEFVINFYKKLNSKK